MIVIKTAREIEKMKDACRISAQALLYSKSLVKPGISTKEIDEGIRKFIESCGAKPSFLDYGGFPASSCISINNVVIHGIPSAHEIVKDGDIVSIDVGAYYNGYHGDNAYTFAAGKVSDEAQDLLNATEESLYEAIKLIKPGTRLGDIGHAVEAYVEARGFKPVRDYVGHGVGAHLHEAPDVPNFGTPGRGIRLEEGMTIAIEPMINQGSEAVKRLSDGWTVLTRDGKLSAHFEHTVAVTSDGYEILTKVGGN